MGGIVTHVRQAAVTGLAMGVALGALEAGLIVGQRAGRGDVEPEIVILAFLANVAFFTVVAALLGAFAGLVLWLTRRSIAPGTLARLYPVAGAFIVPLAALAVWFGHRGPLPVVTPPLLVAALVSAVGLAAVARRVRRPARVVGGVAAASSGALILATLLAVMPGLQTGGVARAPAPPGVATAAVTRSNVVPAPSSETRPRPTEPSGVSVSPTAAIAPTPDSVSPGGPVNVVVVTIDTLRADRIGACGDTVTRTPTLDTLARSGVRSCRTIVPQPGSNASHASLFTGLYPSEHGIRIHMVDRLRSGITTIGELLKANGYATAAIYSWVSFEPAFSGLNRGFDHYEGHVVNLPPAMGDATVQGLAAAYRRLKEYVQVVRTSEAIVGVGDAVEEQIDGRADVTTDAVLTWLDQRDANRDNRPFLLWLHYFDPHYPYTPPPPYDTLFDPDYTGSISGGIQTIWGIGHGTIPIAADSRDNDHLIALYRGEISFTDEHLGRFLDALEERGLADDTLVVVTGDHGDSFGENGRWFHPISLYNSEIQVPLIMRLPGRLPATRLEVPVSLVDVMPTILDILGQPVAATVHGTSLLPLIEGKATTLDRPVFSQSHDRNLLAVVAGRWKLIADVAGGTVEFYDVVADPLETTNLAPSSPADQFASADAARAWDAVSGHLASWAGEQAIDLQPALAAYRPTPPASESETASSTDQGG